MFSKMIVFMSLVLCISSVFGTELSSRKIECPEGWIDGLDLGCFFFAPDDTVGLSWSQAQQYCARLQNGAFLAEIDSAQTQEFIETILEELNVEKYSWWLGGTDFFQEGVWRWERTASNFDYTNWHKGEPNNWHGEEGCLELGSWSLDAWTWNDYNCDPSCCDGLKKRQKPLCQKFL